MRNIKHARTHHRRRHHSHEEHPRRRRRRHHVAEARHHHHRRRHHARNPLSGTGEFIGNFFSALAGFLVADVVDRFSATHPLTAPTTAGGAMIDTPPTTGPYANLFNPTAIAAPLWVSPTRMLVGGGVLLLFWGGAGLIKTPGWKTGLTIAGYGAGVRILGKLAIDGLAAMLMTNPTGQQLFDGEMRANLLAQGQTTAQINNTLPSAGLGQPPLLKSSNHCAPCAANQQGTGYPAPGAAWPSLPREIATANQARMPPPATIPPATQPPASLPPATPPPPPPPGGPQGQLTGVPGMAAPKRFNPYLWGYPEQQEGTG